MKAVKRLVNQINLLKEGVTYLNKNKGEFNISDENKYHISVDNYRYAVYKDTEFLRSKGIIISGSTIIDFNGKLKPVIVVDDYFFKLSSEGQEFVLRHEIGF